MMTLYEKTNNQRATRVTKVRNTILLKQDSTAADLAALPSNSQKEPPGESMGRKTTAEPFHLST